MTISAQVIDTIVEWIDDNLPERRRRPWITLTRQHAARIERDGCPVQTISHAIDALRQQAVCLPDRGGTGVVDHQTPIGRPEISQRWSRVLKTSRWQQIADSGDLPLLR